MSTGERQLLAVFGATGQQGGSVIKTVLADPELSQRYRVRGLTRDTSSAGAQALQSQGVEVIRADASDSVESVASALQGSDVAFVVTVTDYGAKDGTYRTELRQGKRIVDAAVAAGVKYLIFSTLKHVSKTSGGKYTKVGGFDSKAEVEEYIRALGKDPKVGLKSAFFAPGSFMQNFQHLMAPRPAGDGTYALTGIMTPETKLPLIDTLGDTGKYVGAILADLAKYEGKVMSAASELTSMTETVAQMSKALGKTVVYKQISVDVYKTFLPPNARDQLVEMFLYIQDYGYYGETTKEDVEWTGQQARGQLTSLEQYLAENPIHVD
ncbi:uncharacterized protein A1O9_12258 [Exophiala aquamarina CBS 119918]|uniref:NmrA-like domain-containing protein n=1 Tax=Exophiala aquamarina CBS 119918 TaxID=1182545 RepID=A0A072NX62_9EURO|nr:uncharacterized protein A1O9_12258 [Exophiala aquamarina CBS 119918]KEF51623.1 hypothetical protein A1O9_12258 [Exophiala aquamarina CBS 119918]